MKFFSGSLGGTTTVFRRSRQHPYILLAIIVALVCAASLSVKALQGPVVTIEPEVNNSATSSDSSSTVELQVTAGNAQETNKKTSTSSASSELSTPAQESVELIVNGQDIPIPDTGTVTTNIGNDSSKTTVTVQSSNSSTGTSADRSKLRIKATTRTTESVTNRSTSQITEEGVLQP